MCVFANVCVRACGRSPAHFCIYLLADICQAQRLVNGISPRDGLPSAVYSGLSAELTRTEAGKHSLIPSGKGPRDGLPSACHPFWLPRGQHATRCGSEKQATRARQPQASPGPRSVVLELIAAIYPIRHGDFRVSLPIPLGLIPTPGQGTHQETNVRHLLRNQHCSLFRVPLPIL